ncbi:hypothetical protein GCM10018955_73380 [Planomonospora venezuelensis]
MPGTVRGPSRALTPLVAEQDAQVARLAGVAARDGERAAAPAAVAAAGGGFQGLKVEKDHWISPVLLVS